VGYRQLIIFVTEMFDEKPCKVNEVKLADIMFSLLCVRAQRKRGS